MLGRPAVTSAYVEVVRLVAEAAANLKRLFSARVLWSHVARPQPYLSRSPLAWAFGSSSRSLPSQFCAREILLGRAASGFGWELPLPSIAGSAAVPQEAWCVRLFVKNRKPQPTLPFPTFLVNTFPPLCFAICSLLRVGAPCCETVGSALPEERKAQQRRRRPFASPKVKRAGCFPNTKQR